MLTSWKSTRTSIECASERDKSKRKRPRKSTTTSIEEEHIIGACFVQALSHAHPLHPDEVSKSGKKTKRRKAGRDGTNRAEEDAADGEPRLCLTSPHRVVFLSHKRSDGDGTLAESQSRNYVARPGAPSRFDLGGCGSDDGAFRGAVPLGAQYDPASNLIYALRNGGKEVAVWSAAPCSVLRGPDDDASVGDDALGVNGKKRKSFDRRGDSDAGEGLVSCRLQLPGGKVAVTLSPFGIPRKGAQLAASGAAGCCDDGSVWVAARFHSPDERWGAFRLMVVEGSSLSEAGTNGAATGAKAETKRSSKKKSSGSGKGASSTVLGSCAVSGSYDRGKDTFLLSIQSVLEEDREVSFRSHRIIVRNKEGCDSKNPSSLASVEKQSRQPLLTLEAAGGGDIGVQFDAGPKTLSIVHKEAGGDGGWMFASVDVSLSKGALLDTLSTFPIPTNDGASETMVSFGRLSENAAAVLTKSAAGDDPAMTLRIVDTLRKVELSSIGLDEMLQGKACRGMLTNERDSCIALLMTSSEQEEGSSFLEVVSSKLDATPVVLDADESTATKASGNSTSLASALRLLATSALHPASDERSITQKGNSKGGNLASILSDKDDFNNNTSQNDIDHAVEEACKLLSTSAIELVNELDGGSVDKEAPAMNGKSRKGGAKRKKTSAKPLSSWKGAYLSGKELIAVATGGKKSGGSGTLINGIRVGAKGAHDARVSPKTDNSLPTRFVELAFRETATLLFSLHKARATSAFSQEEVQETIQDATSILVEVLQTSLISGREDYGIALHRGNVLLAILQASASSSLVTDSNETIAGTLHVADAMLGHVRDIPERVLLSILRFALRKMKVEDAVSYYSTPSDKISTKGSQLCIRYQELSAANKDDEQKQIVATRLLAEAALEFTSKVVTYSNCNQSFLTKAMRDDIHASSEVETLLLALAKILKQGNTQQLALEDSVPDSNATQVGVTLGTIQWISALTDAHMSTILKMTDEGSLVIDKLQGAVRLAMSQSDLAKELQGMTHVITSRDTTASKARKAATTRPSNDTSIVPYSIERLVF